MKAATHLKAVVVQHYGHYDFKRTPVRQGSKQLGKPFLLRDGGHYVAPVGYGADANDKLDPNIIITRDSSGNGQNKQLAHYYKWLKQPRGNFHNMPLLRFRGDKPIRHESYKDADWPRYESFGPLMRTYVRDKTVINPTKDERFEVLEGLIVIQVK